MIHTKRSIPRVGTMATGLGAYWAQFPGMREDLVGHHQALLRKFNPERAELINAGMVDSADSARRAGQLFREKGVDVVFCQIATYANSETLAPVVRDLDVPVVLLNIQSCKALDMSKVKTIKDWLGAGITCAALPEMTAVLRRLDKRFDMITGYLEGDRIVDSEIDAWCKALAVKRTLNTQNLALFGRPFPGMMDLNVDETQLFRRFGTYTHHLQWDDIADAGDKVTSQQTTELSQKLTETFALAGSLSARDLDAASVVLGGLLRIVDQYDLCGITSHFDGAPTGRQVDVLAALNPALSILITNGVACTVEADMKSALAMVILKGMGGSATLAELYSMDFNQDVVIIGHSGAGDAAISARKPTLDVSEVFHGKSGGGCVTQFYPRLGDVTLLSITQDEAGEYRMVAAEGECVEGPAMALGDTNCRVRFAGGLREFVNRWSSYGPTHHGVLGLGRHIGELRKVALALNLPMEVVSR